MKRSWIVLAVWAMLATASAEPRLVNKSVTCDTVAAVFGALAETFEETPQWQGRTQNTGVVLTVNAKTGAWTLVEYTTITACIIAVGENSSSRWGTPV